MKIVLSTWGSTGDVYPFLALSKQLLKAGHEVRVCTLEIYRDRFAEIGIDFYGVGNPFDEDHFHQTMDAIVRIKNPLKSAIMIAEKGILHGTEKWYQDCLKGMEGYDLAICHSADIAGQEAAIRHHLPWITVSYCPGFIKTVYEAPRPAPNLGTLLNGLMWRVVEWLMRRDIDPLFNEFITSIGGQPRELFGLQGMYSPELNLIAASPSINKPPPDLSKKHKFTGVWFVDEPDYEAPQALTDFLAQGPAPIVITFGSMGGTKGAETTQILLEAVKRTERRAIIHAGWENLGLDESPEDIFFVGYVPYRFLFRQVCCVVHHGGAGTTASVCRAGVPSVVVPHLGDQSYWGNALGKLGVAPKILYRQDMTAKRLANRIDEAIGSKTMAENARRLGQQINTEDGLATAVELIEKHAKEKGIG